MNRMTLTPSAGRREVDERGPSSGQQRNISQQEQWVSLLAGSGLILYGVTQRSWRGLASLLAGASLAYRGWTGHCSTYQLLGVDTASQHPPHRGVRAQHGRKVKCTVHVNRDPQELYDFWRDLKNLPSVMRHVNSVEPINDKRSRWVARGPLDKKLEWEAEIITDRPGEAIAWQSLPDSEVDTAGSVHFNKPTFGEGTAVTVSLKYDPPGGGLVAKLAYLVGQGLEQELEEDLRVFKQLMEAGEIATAAQRPSEVS